MTYFPQSLITVRGLNTLTHIKYGGTTSAKSRRCARRIFSTEITLNQINRFFYHTIAFSWLVGGRSKISDNPLENETWIDWFEISYYLLLSALKRVGYKSFRNGISGVCVDRFQIKTSFITTKAGLEHRLVGGGGGSVINMTSQQTIRHARNRKFNWLRFFENIFPTHNRIVFVSKQALRVHWFCY